MKKIFTLLTFGLLLPAVGYGQFSVGGEIRPRTEFRHGFKRLINDNTDAALFVEQRSRLYFNFKNEKMAFKLTLQDVRIWGETSQIYKADNNLFNIYEAWGSYNFTKASSIKLGRQELNYDNARFLGNLGWAQQGRSHDLLKYELNAANGVSFHAGAAFNQEDVVSNPEPRRLTGTFYSGVNNYKTMQFMWFNKKYENSKFSLLFLNNGLQNAADSSVNFSQTIGGYAVKQINKLKLESELYFQTGKDGAGRDISAYLVALNATLKAGSIPLTIGVDYLSGTDPNSTKNNAFNPLFGTNHKFYGLMDYFFVGNGHQNKGLVDIYLKTKLKTGEKSSLSAHFHQFSSEAKILTESAEEMSSNFGTEVDLVFMTKISPEMTFHLGYSQLFGSESLELVKGGDRKQINNWAWAMFTFKPKFFTTKGE